MPYVVLMAVIVVAGMIVLITGWWRLALAIFRIPARSMTVDKLGLRVPAEHVERVNSILASFAGGFNATIASPSAVAWERYCDGLPALLRPFAQEGAAMGYTPRRLFLFDGPDFERRVVERHPGFRYLHHVGLGFWAGLRRYNPSQLARLVADLDPLYRYLCYDGYGFKHAFFDYPKDPASLRRLDALEGYARHAAYQGVGRAMFFYYMGDPPLLKEHIRKLGTHAPDAAGGVGLASVFIFPDRLQIAQELAARLPADWHADIHVGMCFGLKARSINDPGQLECDLSGAPAEVQAAVRTAIAECDRIEAQVRAEGVEDGYRCWRARVAAWMTGHVQYPLAGLIGGEPGPGPESQTALHAGVGDHGEL